MPAATSLTDLICGKSGDPGAFAGVLPSGVPATLAEALHEARRHHGLAAEAVANLHPSCLLQRKAIEEPAPPRLGAALTARMRERALEQVQDVFPGGGANSPSAASTLHASATEKHHGQHGLHHLHHGRRTSAQIITASEIEHVAQAHGPDGEHCRMAMRKSVAGTAIALLLSAKLPFLKNLEQERQENIVLPPKIMRILNEHREIGAERQEALILEGLAGGSALLPESEVSQLVEAPQAGRGRPTGRRARKGKERPASASPHSGSLGNSKGPASARAASLDVPQTRKRSGSRGGQERLSFFGNDLGILVQSDAIGAPSLRRPSKDLAVPRGAMLGRSPGGSTHSLHAAGQSQPAQHDRGSKIQPPIVRFVGQASSGRKASTEVLAGESPPRKTSKEGILRRPVSGSSATGSPSTQRPKEVPMGRTLSDKRGRTLSSPAASALKSPSKEASRSTTPDSSGGGPSVWKNTLMDSEQQFSSKDAIEIGKTRKRLAASKNNDKIQERLDLHDKAKEHGKRMEQMEVRRNSKEPLTFQAGGRALVIDERSLIKASKRNSKPGVPKARTSTHQAHTARLDDLVKVPFSVVYWSSQQDDTRHAAHNLADGARGSMWESLGPSGQSLVFDTEQDHEICGLVLRCMGAKTDPKDVTLMRSPNKDGPWVTARRVFVNAGSKNRDKQEHEFLFQSGGRCRYWKLDINQNWGAPNTISLLAPLTLLARPAISEDAAGGVGLHLHVPSRSPNSAAMLFDEEQMLSTEDNEVRQLVRRHKIPLDYAERIRDDFRKFATAGNSLSYDDFSKLLHATLSRSAAGFVNFSLDKHAKIPDVRVRNFWKEVEVDNNGGIDFEEFLLWSYRMFYCDSKCEMSQHSKREANTVAERFYAGLGRERLRKVAQGPRDAYETPYATRMRSSIMTDL